MIRRATARAMAWLRARLGIVSPSKAWVWSEGSGPDAKPMTPEEFTALYERMAGYHYGPFGLGIALEDDDGDDATPTP